MENDRIVIKDSKRTAKRRQRKTLGSSVVAYIVELVTNADDSYKRLEASGALPVDSVKTIYIEYKERKGGPILSVADNAEGMSDQRVIDVFGRYGGDNAGGDSAASRGIFGQGATDVMINAAMETNTAMLESFRDEKYIKYYFSYDDASGERNLIDKTPNVPHSQMAGLRASLMIPGNGTRMTFGIPTETVKFNKATIVEEIEGNYSLRFILSAPNRKVVFISGAEQKVLSSSSYMLDSAAKLAEKAFSFTYDGIDLSCKLSLYRNNEKANQGDFATDILVADSNQVIFANTMFHYEKNPKAKDISGILLIDGLYKLCKNHLNSKNPDEIINEDRTGFNEKNDFYKALVNNHVDKILGQALAEHGTSNDVVDISKNKKFRSAIDAVNKWMEEEQKRAIPGGGSKGKNPPLDGLDFGKTKIDITQGVAYSLPIIINARLITESDDIFIELSGNEAGYVSVTPEDVVSYKEEDAKDGIATKTLTIKGLRTCKDDDLVILTVSSLNYKKSIAIKVVDQEIIYPENGLAFENKEATFTPRGNHKSLVWFDTNSIPLGTDIAVKSDGLTVLSPTIVLSEKMMVTDSIGKFNVVVADGELGKSYSLIVETSDGLSTIQSVRIANQAKDPRGARGMFSSIQLYAAEGESWQVTFDQKTGILYINSKHQINLEMMGSLENVDSENPKFTPKQQNYLMLLLCEQAAINDVKELERKNQIVVSEGETFDSYLQHLNEKKLKVFTKVMTAIAA